jgi:hypothetical protein
MLEKVGLFPLLMLVSTIAGAQAPDTVWAGTWTMNVAQSKLHQPAAKEEILKVETPAGSERTVKYTITGTGADGKPINVSFDGVADGKPYPMKSNGQEIGKAVWQRRSSHHYTADETLSDGTTISNTFVMAQSGKRFTGQSQVTGPNASYDETVVWDKP